MYGKVKTAEALSELVSFGDQRTRMHRALNVLIPDDPRPFPAGEPRRILGRIAHRFRADEGFLDQLRTMSDAEVGAIAEDLIALHGKL